MYIEQAHCLFGRGLEEGKSTKNGVEQKDEPYVN